MFVVSLGQVSTIDGYDGSPFLVSGLTSPHHEQAFVITNEGSLSLSSFLDPPQKNTSTSSTIGLNDCGNGQGN